VDEQGCDKNRREVGLTSGMIKLMAISSQERRSKTWELLEFLGLSNSAAARKAELGL